MLRDSARVFVSYSRSDRAFVERLSHDLGEAGIELWIDQDALHGSQDWIEAIGTQLKSSAAVLAILSSAACESKWVRYEIGFAVRLEKPILPVRIQSMTLPAFFDFTIGGKHDVTQPRSSAHSRLRSQVGLRASARLAGALAEAEAPPSRRRLP